MTLTLHLELCGSPTPTNQTCHCGRTLNEVVAIVAVGTNPAKPRTFTMPCPCHATP